MQHNQILDKRYAKALLALGKEDGRFEAYGRELAEFTGALEQAEERKALVSPIFPHGVRRAMLEAILEKAGLSPLCANFIRLLFDKGRLAELAGIAEAYGALVDAENGLMRGSLVSAAPLSGEDLESIKKALAAFAGSKVELTVNEDPSIIGGVVARLGDLSIDGSVRTQLEKLSRSLSAGH